MSSSQFPMAASTESQLGFPEWKDGSVDIPVCAPRPSRVDGQNAGKSGTQNGGQLARNADEKLQEWMGTTVVHSSQEMLMEHMQGLMGFPVVHSQQKVLRFNSKMTPTQHKIHRPGYIVQIVQNQIGREQFPKNGWSVKPHQAFPQGASI